MSKPSLGGWLVHVMREADGALSLEESLHVIMDSMKTYFPSQSVAVLLIDDDTKELRIKISRQISYTFVKKFRQDGPSPTAERVVLEQRPVLLNEIEVDSPEYLEIKLEHDFSSAVLAPIIKNQRGVGYIFCDRADSEKPFSESDLLHLQVIGYLIGNTMEKFELVQESKKLSQIDDATGTLQYKAFVPALATEFERARTHEYQVVLALVAVDAFRKYLETYGIDEAHALLEEVAGLVKNSMTEMDILARFGADEFILCLSGRKAEEALQALEEIRSSVEEKVLGQGEIATSVTIGALSLKEELDFKHPLQEILGALGKNLVAAKGQDSSQVVMGAI